MMRNPPSNRPSAAILAACLTLQACSADPVDQAQGAETGPAQVIAEMPDETADLAKTAPPAPDPAFASPAGAFPPIPHGFYAADQSCAEAAVQGMYVHFTPKFWVEFDGASPVKSIEPAGGKVWKVNFDDGPALTITVTGPASFTEYGRNMTHCPASSVSAADRALYE